MLVVIRIGESFEEFLVAPGAADVLGRAEPARRPSASCANRKPANGSPRADARHQRPSLRAQGFPPRSAPVPLRVRRPDHTLPRPRSCPRSRPLSRLKSRPFCHPCLSSTAELAQTASAQQEGSSEALTSRHLSLQFQVEAKSRGRSRLTTGFRALCYFIRRSPLIKNPASTFVFEKASTFESRRSTET